ncbi:MAG: hypothetical protein ACTSXF_09040 [Promethearchaeota archaeon]
MSISIEILERSSISILEILNGINKKDLKNLRDCYIYDKSSRGILQDIMTILHKGRRARHYEISRNIQKFHVVSPNQLFQYFKDMDFTLSQFKMLLIFFLIFKHIEDCRNTLLKIIEDLSLLRPREKNVRALRHTVYNFIYYPPIQVVKYLLENSPEKEHILKNVLKCSEGDIDKLLGRFGIKNTISNLAIGNRKVFVLSLMDFLSEKDLKNIAQRLGVKIVGKRKLEKILNFIHHTNIGPDDIIETLNAEVLQNMRGYFTSFLDIEENLEIEQFREEVVKRLKHLGLGRMEEFTIDPRFGRFTHVAEDGHICDSEWEVELDNFLNQNGVAHEKPRSATFGQYYSGSYMYPDWVVGDKMIELFGAEHFPGYIEKIQIKKLTNKMDLISLSQKEYIDGRWKAKLRRQLHI